MVQVHQMLESAQRHRDWYIDQVYLADPGLGQECVRIFQLQPIEAEAPSLARLPFLLEG